jgi:hypothetical protein
MSAGWKYELQHELRIRTRSQCFNWGNPWLLVRRRYGGRFAGDVTVYKGYRHDGCTWAPDFHVTRRGSVVHDAPYQFAELIAAHTGWTVREVLEWADYLFLQVMLADVRRAPRGRGWRPLARLVQAWDIAIAYTYYGAVRLVGYCYHVIARSIHGPAELRIKRRTYKFRPTTIN